MLFREASPAKTSARRVAVKDLPEPVQDFGLSISESLTRCGLDLSLPRTVRTCVPVGLAPSSKDLPRWGIMFDGACWELGTSARLTNETECGYLPTPQASDNRNRATANSTERRRRLGKQISLEAAVKFPTPTAHNAKEGAYPAEYTRNTPTLATHAGGMLNPPWVEWLMGWPPGWTDLKPLATDKSHCVPQQPGES